MGNLYLSSDYKNTIISLLIKNENFVKLINPQPSKCSKIKTKDVLLGGTWIYEKKLTNVHGGRTIKVVVAAAMHSPGRAAMRGCSARAAITTRPIL